MKEEYLSRITVENNEVHEKKIIWEIPYNDANIQDWIQGFVTCMVGITFNENQILEAMKDFAEERLPSEDDEHYLEEDNFLKNNN